MKLHSLLTFSFLGFIQANEVDTTSRIVNTKDGIDLGRANTSKSTFALVECTVSQVHGLTPPDATEVPVQFACTTDDDDTILFFDNDATALLGNGFVSGETRLALAPQAMSSDGMINVQQAMAPGAVAISNGVENNRRRKLTTTVTKEVLVVRVVSADYWPDQSEATMSNDVFDDANNLRVRYDDCSNGALIFDPATGTNVNNGVLTVTTTQNLNGMTWQNCGNIAIAGASGIAKDYTMIVCPNEVDFGGAAAWGQLPGELSWYKSQYASAPIVQMHELGHNLGHHHSGKDGVTYRDPTCNMGNRGSWSDAGSHFCFNAAKTWATKWYEEYHVTVDPSNGSYDGTLVGINAVKEDTIAATGQDVVIKIDSSGETDLYIIYNRMIGANNQVPEYGDQVVIVEQSRELRRTSSWRAALSEGQEYTQGDWSGNGNLIVKVCSLETGTPGSARVLVYATGQETLSCNANTTPVPTAVPDTASPTGSPITTSPTSSPVSAPVNAPVNAPPTAVPDTAYPTGSPITASPTSSPVSAPVNVSTGAPVNKPVSAPVSEPTQDNPCQDSSFDFLFNNKRQRNCDWIGRNSDRIDIRCRDPVAADYCPVTCKKPGCSAPTNAPVNAPVSAPVSEPTQDNPCQDSSLDFIYKSLGKRNCEWIGKNSKRIDARCRDPVAADYCPVTCNTLGCFSPVNAPVDAPVNAPVDAPVNAPVDASVVEPTQDNPCQDSPFDFIYKSLGERNCEWIGKNSKQIGKRCRDPVAAENCPVTCSICA